LRFPFFLLLLYKSPTKNLPSIIRFRTFNLRLPSRTKFFFSASPNTNSTQLQHSIKHEDLVCLYRCLSLCPSAPLNGYGGGALGGRSTSGSEPFSQCARICSRCSRSGERRRWINSFVGFNNANGRRRSSSGSDC
ncbi:hypothetical protein K457DRAFT_36345, partial [Linnemannia elongata AG-77]